MIGLIYNEEIQKLTALIKGSICSWNKCVFCCFHEEAAKNVDEIILTTKKIIKNIKSLMKQKPVKILSILNGGSFFELPFCVILEISQITENKIIEIESRPEFLDYKINYLYKMLKPKKLIIRIGFESIYQNIRNDLLKKGINDEEITRIYRLRNKIKNEFNKIDFISYVLFGLDKINEQSVKASVKEFNENLDGVIALKYKKYHNWMPKESYISKNLLEYLKNNCIDVDMTDSKMWKMS